MISHLALRRFIKTDWTMSLLYSLVFPKAIHAEKSNHSRAAVIIHTAFFCQLPDKNAVGRHAGILQFRETAGVSLSDGTGCAQTAPAGAHHQPWLPGPIDELAGQFIMLPLDGPGLRCIQWIIDVPHGLHHQRTGAAENSRFHLLH